MTNQLEIGKDLRDIIAATMRNDIKDKMWDNVWGNVREDNMGYTMWFKLWENLMLDIIAVRDNVLAICMGSLRRAMDDRQT